MDDYVRRQQILRGGDRNLSVVRARSIDVVARSNSVPPKQEEKINVEEQDKEKETKQVKEDVKQKKKMAYKEDIIEASDKIDKLGSSLNLHKEEHKKNIDELNKNIILHKEEIKKTADELNKNIVQNKEETKKTIDELNKKIDSMKTDDELTKAEKVKNKLDNFITLYNENENIHSAAFIELNKELQKLNKRISNIEEMIE